METSTFAISPAELERRYGAVSADHEALNTDTLLFRDYLSLQLRRGRERRVRGTPEVVPYEDLPLSYYDYEKNHRHVARNAQVLDLIKTAYEASSPTESFTVVEVGAGVGRFGEKLTQELRDDIDPRFIYYPSDIAESAIEEMQKKRLFPTKVSATHLPYAKESVDVVYAGEVIEHLTFPMFTQFLSESRRVLKDDGSIIITTPNFDSLPARDEKLKGDLPYNFDEQRNAWASEHVLPFTLNSYKEIVEKFGFEITSVSTNNITWKVVDGVPTEFTVYEKAVDVPDPEKGDTLIISARKKPLGEKTGTAHREDPLRERFKEANKGRDFGIYDRSMDAANEAKANSILPHFPDIEAGDVIVDAGSGTGVLTEMIARYFRGAKVIGEDISGELMEAATSVRALSKLTLGDISTQVFPDDSLKVKYFSTSGHEVESFGGKGRMTQAVQNTFRELAPDGRIIIRDFIKPSGTEPVYMSINENDGFDNPQDATVDGVLDYNLLSTRALLERFRLEFRGGNAFKYEVVNIGGNEYIKIDPEWAYEFYMRKDYTGNWRQEIFEKYSYWTEDEARRVLEDAGYKDVKVVPEWQPYIMDNRLNGKIGLFSMNSSGELTEVPIPPTHMVVVGTKPGERLKSTSEVAIPEVDYQKLKETIQIDEQKGVVTIDGKEFEVEKGREIKGSKKQVFWLKGEPRRVLKVIRKESVNEHAAFKAMYQAVEREDILDLYEVPHMRVLEKDPNGPPYRYYIQEGVPQDGVSAADLIASNALTKRDITQMAGYINRFELGKTWQLDTNPFNWYRVVDDKGESQMVYIDGKVYRYDENWEFKRIGLLQWIKPDYVINLPNSTALIPKATEYEELVEGWKNNNDEVVSWWRQALNPQLQPR